jgi:hypothetical protein
VTETTTKTLKRSKPVVAAKSVRAPTVAHSVKPAAPVARTTTAKVSSTSASSTPTTAQQNVAPAADPAAKPAVPVATAAKKAGKNGNDALPIAGGALAFLALGGAAVAMTRRRHDDEEEWSDEAIVEQEPVEIAAEARSREVPMLREEQPALVAPSAFTWNSAPIHEPGVRPADETHVERAYRGPTPENPSLSLRARLKRAAFMDKRGREAAAGVAAPVDPTAGLPDRLVEERELA